MMGEPIRDVEKLYAGEPQPSERELGFREGIEAAAKVMKPDGPRTGHAPACCCMRCVAWIDYDVIRALSPTPQPSEGERELAEALDKIAKGQCGDCNQFADRVARAALAKFNGGDK